MWNGNGPKIVVTPPIPNLESYYTKEMKNRNAIIIIVVLIVIIVIIVIIVVLIVIIIILIPLFLILMKL
jgi:hypothetical protein